MDAEDNSNSAADNEYTSSAADVTDDSCTLQYIEIVPLTRDTGDLCAMECHNENWPDQVKLENLPVVKQEPQAVSCTGFISEVNSQEV